ncbi:MAG: hypothetical protein DWQ08_10850, partial [Proteobacteria bacterium]
MFATSPGEWKGRQKCNRQSAFAWRRIPVTGPPAPESEGRLLRGVKYFAVSVPSVTGGGEFLACLLCIL